MLTLMVKVRDLLINDSRITALVPIEAIGGSVRQPAHKVSIEYELSDQDRGNQGVGQQTTELLFHVHSESGTALCYAITDALYQLLTPATLSDPDRGYRVARVRQTGLKQAPRNEFVSTIIVRYQLHIKELTPKHRK